MVVHGSVHGAVWVAGGLGLFVLGLGWTCDFHSPSCCFSGSTTILTQKAACHLFTPDVAETEISLTQKMNAWPRANLLPAK